MARLAYSTSCLLILCALTIVQVTAFYYGGHIVKKSLPLHCSYENIGRVGIGPATIRQMAGVWYLVAQTTRKQDMVLDDDVMYVQTDDTTATFTHSMNIGSSMGDSCTPAVFPMQINASNPREALLTFPGENGQPTTVTMKLVRFYGGYMIAYDCTDGRPVPGANCERDEATVLIYSRGRNISPHVTRALIRIASRSTCFQLTEFRETPQSVTCELPENTENTA